MSEDGHKYFFGSMPEMPWRKKMKIYVNGQEREVSIRAYNTLKKKVILNDDPRTMCCLYITPRYICTCVKGHKHPHIAHGSDENDSPLYAVEVIHD